MELPIRWVISSLAILTPKSQEGSASTPFARVRCAFDSGDIGLLLLSAALLLGWIKELHKFCQKQKNNKKNYGHGAE